MRSILLFIALALASPRAQSQNGPEPPFLNSKTPVTDAQLKRLAAYGYKLQPDGKVISSETNQPVAETEMPMVLEELAGKDRFKAMIELEIVFNQYGYKNLPSTELEKVRETAKESWDVLPEQLREDLRPYFTAFELETLQRTVAPPEPERVWLPRQKPLAEAPQAPSAPPANPPAAAPVTTVAAAVSASGSAAASVAAAIPKPAAPPVPPVAPAPVIPAPVPVNQPLFNPPPAPIPTAPNPASPGAPVSTGAFVATIPAVRARLETAHAVSTAAAAAVAVPAPEPIPDYLDVTSAVFDQFLNESSYDPAVRNILRLIARHAPGESRRTALGVVMRYAPKINLDAVQSGAGLYAARRDLHAGQKTGSTAITLNPGPVIVRKSSFLMGSSDYLLPASTDFYRNAGISAPPLQAIAGDANSANAVQTVWGPAAQFTDSSLRLTYPIEQLAGTLLGELIGLDGHLRGWDSDVRHSGLRSEAAAFLFYRQFKQDTGKDPELIPELRARFADWQDRPDDYWDLSLEADASPHAGRVVSSLSGTDDERKKTAALHDLDVIHAAGMISPKESKNLFKDKPDGAPKIDASKLVQEISALDRSSFIGTIWKSEDQRFREELNAKK